MKSPRIKNTPFTLRLQLQTDYYEENLDLNLYHLRVITVNWDKSKSAIDHKFLYRHKALNG